MENPASRKSRPAKESEDTLGQRDAQKSVGQTKRLGVKAISVILKASRVAPHFSQKFIGSNIELKSGSI